MNKNIVKAGFLAASGTFLTIGAGAQDRPNVLFLLADDMTFEGIHAFGNDEVITPNIDRLAARGVIMTNTFNMGGWIGAVSVASRSMLMTGRYIWHSRDAEKAGYTEVFDGRTFWPQIMKDAGYTTYMTGKWHVSHYEPQTMFDRTEGVKLGGMLRIPSGYNRPLSRENDDWLPWDESNGGYWQEDGRHWTEVQADNIIGYLNECKDSREPQFMYVAFNAPHDPRQSPKEYVEMYDVDKVRVPEDFQPEHPLKELMGCSEAVRDEALAPFPRTEYAVRKHRQEYYAIITHLDNQIGRILDALDASGMADNTIVVLTGDNGLSCGHHGLIGKQSLYDPAIKVPMIVCGPNLPKGEKRDAMIYMQDIVPTIYELVGVEKPACNQFQSFLPEIMSSKAEGRQTIYGAYQSTLQRMIRTKRYKLFFIVGAEKAYLFDLKKDPHEMHNLYGKPRYRKLVQKLMTEYGKEAPITGDTLELPKSFN